MQMAAPVEAKVLITEMKWKEMAVVVVADISAQLTIVV